MRKILRLLKREYLAAVKTKGFIIMLLLMPVLMGVGVARCAPAGFYLAAALTIPPFIVIPVALGSALTLLLVNVFPARRARDI